MSNEVWVKLLIHSKTSTVPLNIEGLQWISDYITHFVGEITYSFQNVIGSTVEVSEWISNYIPHFIMDVMTYTCCD